MCVGTLVFYWRMYSWCVVCAFSHDPVFRTITFAIATVNVSSCSPNCHNIVKTLPQDICSGSWDNKFVLSTNIGTSD